MKRLIVFIAALGTAAPLLALPDLTITTGTAKSVPTNVGFGAEFTFSFELRNAGDAAVASPAVKVPVPAGAQVLSSSAATGSMQCVPYTGYLLCSGIAGWSLGAGAVAPVNVTMKAPVTAGAFTSVIHADPDARVAEASETNNKATISGQFMDSPRVSATVTSCPSSVRAVNTVYAVEVMLFNRGTLDVRYPGLRIAVDGAGAQVTVTNVTGGTTSGLTLNSARSGHSFTVLPPPEKTPLRAGQYVKWTIFAKSSAASKPKITASIDTAAIQDTTPADNTATCVVMVQ